MPTQNGQGNGKVSMSGGWTWAIPAKPKNPDPAWEFIKTLQPKEGELKYAIDDAQIAVREGRRRGPGYLKASPKHRVLHRPGGSAPIYRPALRRVPEGLQRDQQAMEAVMTGQSTPDEAAKNYDEAVEGIVGKTRRPRFDGCDL